MHERFNNAHHGFMKALKSRIAVLWVFQKFASRFMKFIKTCISFVGPLEQCASPFYAAPENVHLLVYKSFKNLHRDLCGSEKTHFLGIGPVVILLLLYVVFPNCCSNFPPRRCHGPRCIRGYTHTPFVCNAPPKCPYTHLCVIFLTSERKPLFYRFLICYCLDSATWQNGDSELCDPGGGVFLSYFMVRH